MLIYISKKPKKINIKQEESTTNCTLEHHNHPLEYHEPNSPCT